MIKLNDSGPQVRRLQTRLNTVVTPRPKLKIDGVFGRVTEQAVKAYQASKGLVVDGYAGPKTLAALGLIQVLSPPAPFSTKWPSLVSLKKACPARTPGVLGLNDQGDPSAFSNLGTTPGPTGINDYADPMIGRVANSLCLLVNVSTNEGGSQFDKSASNGVFGPLNIATYHIQKMLRLRSTRTGSQRILSKWISLLNCKAFFNFRRLKH